MTAIVTEHKQGPLAFIAGVQVQPEVWFDVSCDDCGWQSKKTTDKDRARQWRLIHDGKCPA